MLRPEREKIIRCPHNWDPNDCVKCTQASIKSIDTTQKEAQGGVKDDSQKVRMDLVSSLWLFGVGAVLTYGAKKYAAHNWRKGIERSRLLGASLRHILAYLGGEDSDPETGLLHLYHASCCLMFASELHFTQPHTDDRYQPRCPHDNIAKPVTQGSTEASWFCVRCGAPYLSFKQGGK